MLSRLISHFGQKAGAAKNPWRDFPFGRAPRANAETYRRLHAQACAFGHPEIDALEAAAGYSIDRAWMDALALHTQTVIKESALNFSHGRVLYATLRSHFANWKPSAGEPALIVETGTARGFSALCMAKALVDANITGNIVTIDVLPHDISMYWNCIDDADGPKTRRELLVGHEALLDRVVFVEGDTREMLGRLGLGRVHAAYLDAQHTLEDVMSEFRFIAARQRAGDIIIFDDVTPALFPGVVEAVDAIERDHPYSMKRIQVSEQRGYAIATRLAE